MVAPGLRLGTYEVLSLIGAGGMGEVYRARDTRLNRDVAIKVLPADRLADEQRRRRFLHEAQSASALNHPHIVTIYEIESAGEIDFIVMEYVRGRSLDAVIPRGGMRLNELLRMAIPVADALAAAHARGIIHRDLKPANVIVSTEGVVKVLDFGLAKLIGNEVTPDEETVTHLTDVVLSAPGAIAGTAAYMAPEQATGAKVDARSDIFSLGAMLYEMATGTRAFRGDSMADTLAAVIRSQPTPPTQLVATLPRELERLILRCLRKEPERRYQTMLDVRNELQEIKEESDSGALGSSAAVVAPRRRTSVYAVAAAALVIVAAVVTWFVRSRVPVAVQGPPMQVVPLTSLPGWEWASSFAPDGEQIAFAWNPALGAGNRVPGRSADSNWDVYVKIVGSSDVRRLTTHSDDDYAPQWSPDGRQIAFLRSADWDNARVHVMSALGTSERKVSDFPIRPFQISWSADGRYIAAARWEQPTPDDVKNAGIYAVPVQGGEPKRLTKAASGTLHVQPAFSPDGHRLAYASCRIGCEISVMDLNEPFQPRGLARRVASTQSVQQLTWARDGRSILYDDRGFFFTLPNHLWRVPADGTSSPERVEVAGIAAAPAIARARDRLAFVRALYDVDVYRAEDGKAPQPVAVSSYSDIDSAFSPDGRRVAFSSARSGQSFDIWIGNTDGTDAKQLTRGLGLLTGSPSWSPDGRRIAFDSQGTDGDWHVWTMTIEGEPPAQLTSGAGSQNFPTWSGDGRWIYFRWDPGTGSDVWRIPSSGGTPERLTTGAGAIYGFESTDGRSVVYQGHQNALFEKPLGEGSARQLIPCATWTGFVVHRDGIYYIGCEPDAPVYQLNPRTGQQRLVTKLPRLEPNTRQGLSVSPDGKAILYNRHVMSASDLFLIENYR